MSEPDLAAWGMELHWIEPEKIEFALVQHSQPLPETPRLQAYNKAMALCDEDELEQGLEIYEQILKSLGPEEFLLAQMTCWARSSALQQLERFDEAWASLTTLLTPGRRWLAPLPLALNWLATATTLAAQTNRPDTAAGLLHLWHGLAPDFGLQQRFDDLVSETFETLAQDDLNEAVDWLDEIRIEWESGDNVLPHVRLLLMESMAELLEFEEALEEAEGVVVWARRREDHETAAEWTERVDNLREQARDPYNLARLDDRRSLARLGKVNALGKSGRNALMGAVVSNNAELAVWLLERNANPNIFGADGWNPILLAADYDHPDMVSLLVKWKADLMSTNDLDQNCLHVAAWQDYQATARRVIELGIDVTYCDAEGNSALHLAACEPVPEMIEMLVSVLPVDMPNSGNEATPFMYAAESNQVENLELLLRLGANPEARDLEGKSALDYAQAHDAREAIAFLKKLAKKARK